MRWIVTHGVFFATQVCLQNIYSLFRTLWFWQNEAKFANLFKGMLASSLTLWVTGSGRAN